MKPKFFLLTAILLSFALASHAQGTSPKASPSTQRLFFEKVYLHIDRDYYSSGEDIWFKAYLLNAQVNQLLNTSNNLYVELVSPKAEIISRKVVKLDDGIGYGDFNLNDSIPGGRYRVRAYTNWMLNFGDKFVFEKEILVNGADKSNANLSNNNKAGVSNPSKPLTAKAQQPKIQFFPEGGSMIEGVSGLIAYKAESAEGKGVKVKGYIISSTGDTITSFESKESGIGSLMLLPVPGTKYAVKGHFNGSIPFSSALPDALPTGFSGFTQSADSSRVRVIISTNETTLNEYKGREFEIRGRHGGISYFAAKFALTDLQTLADIPKADLPAGIAAISLTDDKGRPHFERLIYIDHPKRNVRLTVSTNKPTYSPKERVVINIKAVDPENKPVKTDLSLAAVDAGIVPQGQGNIVSYMMLESEVRGEIEHPEQYFDSKNPDRLKQLDLLLLTQGWRDFLWKRLKDTTLKISHINEAGFTISGRVREKNADKPMPGLNVTLFANGAKGNKLFGATTNAQGRYYFDRINLEGSQSIKLVSADNKGNKKGMLLVDSLYADPLPAIALRESEPPQKFEEFKSESQKRKTELKINSLSDTITLKEVSVKASKSKTVFLFGDVLTSFGYPDQNFTITQKDHDYANLSHFLLHRVSGAMQSDDPEYNGVLFMSDGKKVRPRFRVDKREDLFLRADYFELPMDQIVQVTVKHMLGSTQLGIDSATNMSTSTPGGHVYLIDLTLKPTAFSRPDLSLLSTNVTGYYQQRLFYSPIYPQGVSSAKKDLRTTIYWHPKVHTDENGSATVYFYNADPKGQVRLAVEGVTEKGLPIAESTSYEVK